MHRRRHVHALDDGWPVDPAHDPRRHGRRQPDGGADRYRPESSLGPDDPADRVASARQLELRRPDPDQRPRRPIDRRPLHQLVRHWPEPIQHPAGIRLYGHDHDRRARHVRGHHRLRSDDRGEPFRELPVHPRQPAARGRLDLRDRSRGERRRLGRAARGSADQLDHRQRPRPDGQGHHQLPPRRVHHRLHRRQVRERLDSAGRRATTGEAPMAARPGPPRCGSIRRRPPPRAPRSPPPAPGCMPRMSRRPSGSSIRRRRHASSTCGPTPTTEPAPGARQSASRPRPGGSTIPPSPRRGAGCTSPTRTPSRASCASRSASTAGAPSRRRRSGPRPTRSRMARAVCRAWRRTAPSSWSPGPTTTPGP